MERETWKGREWDEGSCRGTEEERDKERFCIWKRWREGKQRKTGGNRIRE